jgi:hypothetical protein
MTHALPLHPPVCSGGTAQTRSAVPVPEPPRAVHTVSSKYIGGRDEDRRETETRESACLPVLVGAERVQIRSYRTGEQQRILTPISNNNNNNKKKKKKSSKLGSSSWKPDLGNNGYLRSKVRQSDGADVHSVDEDRTGGRFDQSQKRKEQSRLPGARAAADAHLHTVGLTERHSTDIHSKRQVQRAAFTGGGTSPADCRTFSRGFRCKEKSLITGGSSGRYRTTNFCITPVRQREEHGL